MNVLYTGLEGLQRAEAQIDRASSRIAKFNLSLSDPPEDVVDLSAEAVSLLAAETHFKANLKAAEAGAELDKSVIDLLG